MLKASEQTTCTGTKSSGQRPLAPQPQLLDSFAPYEIEVSTIVLHVSVSSNIRAQGAFSCCSNHKTKNPGPCRLLQALESEISSQKMTNNSLHPHKVRVNNGTKRSLHKMIIYIDQQQTGNHSLLTPPKKKKMAGVKVL